MLSEKPWTADSVIRLWLAVLVCLLVGMGVGGTLKQQFDSEFAVFIVGTVCFHWAALILVHLFLREHGVGWKEGFGFNVRLSAWSVLGLIALTLVCVPVAAALGQFSSQLMTGLGLQPERQALVTTIQKTTSLWPQVYMSMMAVSLVPAAEEILFRGILYPFFRRRVGWVKACCLVAALFGVVHGNLMAFVPLTFLGLALGWVYERTGNLLAPIMLHSLFNLSNLFWMAFGRILEGDSG